jgi:ribose transport system substrate-binding protein
MSEEYMPEHEDTAAPQLSRRQLLQYGAASIGAVALAGKIGPNLRSVAPNFGRFADGLPGSPFKGPVSMLKAYNPNLPAGAKPPSSLPKSLAWDTETDTAYWLSYRLGLSQAAADNGLSFAWANSDGDGSTAVSQLTEFTQRGVGALCGVPVGGAVPEQPIQLAAIKAGAMVSWLLSGPATTVVTVNQYEAGYIQGKDAAEFIKTQMGGQAEVVYYNANQTAPALIPREQGAIAGLQTGGSGIKVVANIFNTPGVATGASLMTTLLQAHPNINVVLGDDESVLGAYEAFKAAGKLSQVKYMSGINGSADALAVVAKGDTPYKVDYGFNFGQAGYAVGQAAGKWFKGESIPMIIVMSLVPIRSSSDITAFNNSMNNARSVFKADNAKYLSYLGNISYATRGSYVDFAPTV